MSTRTPLAVLTAVAAGAAAAYIVWPDRRSDSDRARETLVTYLRDHLSGSDVGLLVVGRLSAHAPDAAERGLFRRLAEEFEDERDAIRALLAELGSSGKSVKRAASLLSGAAASLTAGGDTSDLSLLRTLEALTIAVQGKRCLWRALQSVKALHSPHRLTFAQLEAQAVAQWDALDARRLAVAHRCFAAVRPPRPRPD